MVSKWRRHQRSQNFLHDRRLVQRLFRQFHPAQNDTVLEIGPGNGIITQELLGLVRDVIAVEIDSALCQLLLQKFDRQPGLLLFNADFLTFPLPSTPYSVFANTPFAIEGELIRKLLDGENPPREAHLVVRQDAGERWVGHQKESCFSVLRKPWFDMVVSHRFKRADFQPKPRVNAILITVVKRDTPLVGESERPHYNQFIRQGFGGGRRINTNLRPFLSSSQLKGFSQEHQFSDKAKPTDLSFHQWLQLFQLWLELS